MIKTKTLTNYDQNASDYDHFRRPSPIIQEHLFRNFSGSQGPILSIGCGTGRMENALSNHFNIFGLDRSIGMLTQAKNRLAHLIQGDMNALPFGDDTFSGLYFMQSLHHFGANLDLTPEMRDQARRKVLMEATRVLHQGSLVIIQRDPSQNMAVWFWKYFPQALETKLKIQPKVSLLVRWLQEFGLSKVAAIPINDPMANHFYDPASPLDPSFRRSFSEFSYLSEDNVLLGINKLQQAIQNGKVIGDIERCKNEFKKIGGTVFMISAEKKSLTKFRKNC